VLDFDIVVAWTLFRSVHIRRGHGSSNVIIQSRKVPVPASKLRVPPYIGQISSIALVSSDEAPDDEGQKRRLGGAFFSFAPPRSRSAFTAALSFNQDLAVALGDGGLSASECGRLRDEGVFRLGGEDGVARRRRTNMFGKALPSCFAQTSDGPLFNEPARFNMLLSKGAASERVVVETSDADRFRALALIVADVDSLAAIDSERALAESNPFSATETLRAASAPTRVERPP
jgi:hypothetical protein